MNSGQLETACREFYQTEVMIDILNESIVSDMTNITYRMKFDNSSVYYNEGRPRSSLRNDLTISKSLHEISTLIYADNQA